MHFIKNYFYKYVYNIILFFILGFPTYFCTNFLLFYFNKIVIHLFKSNLYLFISGTIN